MHAVIMNEFGTAMFCVPTISRPDRKTGFGDRQLRAAR